MPQRKSLLCLALSASCVLLAARSPAADADAPRTEPLAVGTADVLKLMGASAWKWNHRPAEPYKEMTVRLMHYTRRDDGGFERESFTESSSSFQEPHGSDDILIGCVRQDGHPAFLVSFGHGTSGPSGRPGLAWPDFTILGGQDGGPPRRIGEEYILLARYKGNRITDRKDDLLEYVSVEVETK